MCAITVVAVRHELQYMRPIRKALQSVIRHGHLGGPVVSIHELLTMPERTSTMVYLSRLNLPEHTVK